MEKILIFHDAEYLLIFSKDFLVKIVLKFFSYSCLFSVLLTSKINLKCFFLYVLTQLKHDLHYFFLESFKETVCF